LRSTIPKHVQNTKAEAGVVIAIGLLIFVKVVRPSWLFIFRAVGAKLDFGSIAQAIRRQRAGSIKSLLDHVKVMPIVLAVTFAIGAGHYLALKLGYKVNLAAFYVSALGLFFIVILGVALLQATIKTRIHIARLRSAKQQLGSTNALILRASSWDEVAVWLKEDLSGNIPSIADVRSFLRFSEAVSQGSSLLCGQTLLERKQSMTRTHYRLVTSRLFSRLSDLEAAITETDRKPVPSASGHRAVGLGL
jgi:hypothetical protein